MYQNINIGNVGKVVVFTDQQYIYIYVYIAPRWLSFLKFVAMFGKKYGAFSPKIVWKKKLSKSVPTAIMLEGGGGKA